MIDSFHGEYAFLSNFWEEPFELGGRVVPTAEHAYQALKAPAGHGPVKDLILKASTPGHAKRLGRRAKLRDDWEDVKVEIMRKILAAKFAPGTELAAKLVATGEHHLLEGNTWGDKFWGCIKEIPTGPWVGANTLGLLLMERRDELRSSIHEGVTQ